MMNDRAGPFLPRRTTLDTVERIGCGKLVSPLAGGDALQADFHARVIHHREHRVEALVLFPDEITDGALVVAEIHDAGRAAVDTELVFDRRAVKIVARADLTVVADEEFRHEEQ